MRKSLGYNWTDYKANTEMLNELKFTSIIEKINVYESNQKNYMNRINLRMSLNSHKQVQRIESGGSYKVVARSDH